MQSTQTKEGKVKRESKHTIPWWVKLLWIGYFTWATFYFTKWLIPGLSDFLGKEILGW